MTESEWLVSKDPAAMLRELEWRWNAEDILLYRSDRKLRLFACACCRAAGRKDSVVDGYEKTGNLSGEPALDWAMDWGMRGHQEIDGDLMANFLRDIFGNPFRTPLSCVICENRGRHKQYRGEPSQGHDWVPCPCCLGPWLTWRGGTIPQIARTLYDERRFEELPVLADALMEAGCPEIMECPQCKGRGVWHPKQDSGEWLSTPSFDCLQCGGTGRLPHPLLAHCRSRGPHARGCHVLDLLLGKE